MANKQKVKISRKACLLELDDKNRTSAIFFNVSVLTKLKNNLHIQLSVDGLNFTGDVQPLSTFQSGRTTTEEESGDVESSLLSILKARSGSRKAESVYGATYSIMINHEGDLRIIVWTNKILKEDDPPSFTFRAFVKPLPHHLIDSNDYITIRAIIKRKWRRKPTKGYQGEYRAKLLNIFETNEPNKRRRTQEKRVLIDYIAGEIDRETAKEKLGPDCSSEAEKVIARRPSRKPRKRMRRRTTRAKPRRKRKVRARRKARKAKK